MPVEGGVFADMKRRGRGIAHALQKVLRGHRRSWSFPSVRWRTSDGAWGRFDICTVGDRGTFGVWVDRLSPGRQRTQPLLAISFDLPAQPGLPTRLARRMRCSRIMYGSGEKNGERRRAYAARTVVEVDGDGWIFLTRYWDALPAQTDATNEAKRFFERWHAVVEEIAEYKWPPVEVSESSRRRVREAVLRRRGQAVFRQNLLNAYARRCAISGCDVLDVLEAAHIEGYALGKDHAASNGILLRADLHNLFDLGLLGIEPRSMKVVLFGPLAETEYGKYSGRVIALPRQAGAHPDRRKLAAHLASCARLDGRRSRR
jgi:hypothetical protein